MKMNNKTQKILVGTLIVTGLLGGVNGIILPASKAYAAEWEESDLQTFINNDNGLLGSFRDGVYIDVKPNAGGVTWNRENKSDKSAAIKDNFSAPFYLIDRDKLPAMIEKLKNANTLELTDLLSIITLDAPFPYAIDNDTSAVGSPSSRRLHYSNPSLDSNIDNHTWLQLKNTEPHKIEWDEKETKTTQSILDSSTLINDTDAIITGHTGDISEAFTDTVSSTITNTAALGFKQTLKTSGNLGLFAADFTAEFSQTYTYADAEQKLKGKTTTFTQRGMDIPIQPHSKYKATAVMNVNNKKGKIKGTTRLIGDYTVHTGGTDYEDHGLYNAGYGSQFDLSIFKKFKTIQLQYPELWNVLKEKGIDLDDKTKEVIYTGGIGVESTQGVETIVQVQDLSNPKKQVSVNIGQTQDQKTVGANGTINVIKDQTQAYKEALKKGIDQLKSLDGKTGWQNSNGKWHYLGADGAMKTGWVQDKGKWYCLGTDGAMATGWLQVDNRWYYLNEDGSMVTGFKNIGGKKYYFGRGKKIDDTVLVEGQMATGEFNIDHIGYVFGEDGALKGNI